MVIWFLRSFDFRLNLVSNPESSILSAIAGVISPVFAPLGFNDWRISTSLIAGFMAKESVVSTMSVLYGGADITKTLGIASACSLLTFCLLYTPCVAAVAAIRREIGRGWAAVTVVGQCVIAWMVAFAVHGIALLILSI